MTSDRPAAPLTGAAQGNGRDALITSARPAQALTGAALVVGGGIAGMQASLDLAEQGFRVYLVEQQSAIGGHMAQLDKTFPTNDCAMCTISPKLVEVGRHRNIDLLTDTEVVRVEGQPGDFTVTLRRKPRYVDTLKCVGCGDCAAVCPVSLPDPFNEGLSQRRAAYKLYPQAVPNAYAIEKRGTAPCRAACPAGQRAQGYIALIAEGRYREAYRVIKEDNPFPSVCGRTCHHPCEGHCARALVDAPVGIMALKRFVMDYALAYGREKVEPAPRTRPEWVAVVGSGPAGLTAAHDLAKLGYGVTVYEALPVPGGMMRVGIPAHRLPKGVLQQDIDDILALGVVLKTDSPVRDPLQLLEQGYDAVCLATGISSRDHSLGIEGEDAEGVLSAATFLRKINLGEPIQVGRRVAVIGGGITALDAAAVARRLGAEQVHVALDRPRGELPAYAWELAAVEAEGIHLHEHTAAARILTAAARVAGVQLARTGKGVTVDERGRRRPRLEPGSEFTLDTDTVIATVGQQSDLTFLDPAFDELTGDPNTLASEHPGLFVVGGRKTGASYIIEAVALGHRVAGSIHRYLQRLPLVAPEAERPPAVKIGREELAARLRRGEIRLQPRQEPALIPLDERVTSFREVVLPLTERQARAEAQRCLQCGLCSECLACVYACGVNAIDHNMVEREEQLKVGAVILAPGYQAYRAELSAEYGLGRYPNVVTALQLERMLNAGGPTRGQVLRPSDGRPPRRVAFLQCVGSRDRSHDYCSAVCCMYAAKQAMLLKEHHLETEVQVFVMDVRAYSKGYAAYYQRAQEQYGIQYTRCRVSELHEQPGTHNLLLRYAGEQLLEPGGRGRLASHGSAAFAEPDGNGQPAPERSAEFAEPGGNGRLVPERSAKPGGNGRLVPGRSAEPGGKGRLAPERSAERAELGGAAHARLIEESFDLVVLSIGMEISESVRRLARELGVEIDDYGFCHTVTFRPVETSRPGIYAVGPFRQPKDIPESIVDASGAAGLAAGRLAPARGSLARHVEYPPERDVSAEAPRVGVFVCHCGSNIAGYLDVEEVTNYASALPHVVHAEHLLYACSQDSTALIQERTREHGLNRVVVASCSPLTHAPLFQDSLRQAGLNEHLLAMANIRNHCSWVHSDDWELATAKAKELVRMALARAQALEPLPRGTVSVHQAALVVGGGPAGMNAALTLAEQGFPVHLVEREAELGGNLRKLHFGIDPGGTSTVTGRCAERGQHGPADAEHEIGRPPATDQPPQDGRRSQFTGEAIPSFPTDPQAYLAELAAAVQAHPLISVHLASEVTRTSGFVGNFISQLRSPNGELTPIQHGVTILATGGQEYRGPEYGYGGHARILTQQQFEAWLAGSAARNSAERALTRSGESSAETGADPAYGGAAYPRPAQASQSGPASALPQPSERLPDPASIRQVVMIQCVGPAEQNCTRTCCAVALKNALRLNQANPDVQVVVLYRDIRTYGFLERLYAQARRLGVLFVRYDPASKPVVQFDGAHAPLRVYVQEPNLGRSLELQPDLLVLSMPMIPASGSRELASRFKVPVDADGWFLEAHIKLRPVEFASEGLFLAGAAHYPKLLEESIVQALAAASRAGTVLAQEALAARGSVARVDPALCVGCLTCLRACPYGAPAIRADLSGVGRVAGAAYIEPTICQGCGICAAECPAGAIELLHYRRNQMERQALALFGVSVAEEARR